MPRKSSVEPGMRFSRLVVVGDSGQRASNRDRLWECRCDCGGSALADAYNLRRGAILSCGCYKNEIAAARFRALNTTHGMRYHSLRHPWGAMIQRCFNPSHPQYRNYGARGITVSERWLGRDGLANFITDMGEKPGPAHSLDRIDNDGNYEPENCRWATPEQQVNNRRPWGEWHVSVRPKYLSVKCPKCGASAGEFCRTSSGAKRRAHKKRLHRARRAGVYPNGHGKRY